MTTDPITFAWEGTDNPNDPHGVARFGCDGIEVSFVLNDFATASKLSHLLKSAYQRGRSDTALAQPEPEGVTDEELWQIWHDVDGSIPTIFRAVLARFGRPAIKPVPVPVAERPWEREGWCDAEGRCWMVNELLEWAFRKQYKSLDSYYFYGYTHLLPHWALPVPTSQEATDA
jgi:hypothetical protein